MTDPIRKATAGAGVAAALVAVTVNVERSPDGRVERVELFHVLPLFNRQWPLVKRIRARRESRRAARDRDAP